MGTTTVRLAKAPEASVFEPFVTGKERGTGLGLAISRRILEQHGGRLTASNREPCGAVFTVELPLSTTHPDANAPAQNGDSAMKQVTINA